MKLLLDTHAFMWWDSDPAKLSPAALTAILDPANEVWASVANVWEMAIKSQLGKLTLHASLGDIVAQQQTNGLQFLGVTVDHVLGVEGLPAVHRDPFDRLLAAQSIIESAALVTNDRIFALYPIRVLW
jgi:PIN domain nuclease of toxin-antitoxin system